MFVKWNDNDEIERVKSNPSSGKPSLQHPGDRSEPRSHIPKKHGANWASGCRPLHRSPRARAPCDEGRMPARQQASNSGNCVKPVCANFFAFRLAGYALPKWPQACSEPLPALDSGAPLHESDANQKVNVFFCERPVKLIVILGATITFLKPQNSEPTMEFFEPWPVIYLCTLACADPETIKTNTCKLLLEYLSSLKPPFLRKGGAVDKKTSEKGGSMINRLFQQTPAAVSCFKHSSSLCTWSRPCQQQWQHL